MGQGHQHAAASGIHAVFSEGEEQMEVGVDIA